MQVEGGTKLVPHVVGVTPLLATPTLWQLGKCSWKPFSGQDTFTKSCGMSHSSFRPSYIGMMVSHRTLTLYGSVKRGALLCSHRGPAPLLAEEYSKEKVNEVFRLRADVDDWLMRLSGKTLVCNCGCNTDEC